MAVCTTHVRASTAAAHALDELVRCPAGLQTSNLFWHAWPHARLWPVTAAQVVAAHSPGWFVRVSEGMEPLSSALGFLSKAARFGAGLI